LAAQRVRKSRFRPYQEPKNVAVRPEQGQQSTRALGSAEERSPPSVEGQPDRINGFDLSQAHGSQNHEPWVDPAIPQSPNAHANAASKPIPVPSPEVARLLIEMYFTRVYNATLLFHKETFLSEYAANKLPNFVTHAVFALASM
jgi:hypothetical protein